MKTAKYTVPLITLLSALFIYININKTNNPDTKQKTAINHETHYLKKNTNKTRKNTGRALTEGKIKTKKDFPDNLVGNTEEKMIPFDYNKKESKILLPSSLKPEKIFDITTATNQTGETIRRILFSSSIKRHGKLIKEEKIAENGTPETEDSTYYSASTICLSAPNSEYASKTVKHLKEEGFNVTHKFPTSPVFKIHITPKSADDIRNQISEIKQILTDEYVFVETDTLSLNAFCATRNDPRYSEQWYLPIIEADQAWDVPVSGTQAYIAVIDSGIAMQGTYYSSTQDDNPDLKINLWTNLHDSFGDNNDSDGNGYYDDYHGYNFYESYVDPNDPSQNDLYMPCDWFEHGTSCAGVIAADPNNNEGISGVCPNVKVVAAQATTEDDIYISDIISAIYYAIALKQHGMNMVAVNISLSTQRTDAYLEAIAKLNQAGIICCNAAGNSGDTNLRYPSMFKTETYTDPVTGNTLLSPSDHNLLTVGCTDSNDDLSSFSNYHSSLVEIDAPGEDILTLHPYNINGDATRWPAYHTVSGTSFSSPLTAGVCAMVYNVNPQLTSHQIIDIIKDNVDVLPNLSGKCSTSGRLNAKKAVLAAQALLTDYYISGHISGAIKQGVTVSIDATHSAVSDESGNYTISGLSNGTYQ
jgi:uncharacterized protein YajQ (UPF0234 family)